MNTVQSTQPWYQTSSLEPHVKKKRTGLEKYSEKRTGSSGDILSCLYIINCSYTNKSLNLSGHIMVYNSGDGRRKVIGNLSRQYCTVMVPNEDIHRYLRIASVGFAKKHEEHLHKHQTVEMWLNRMKPFVWCVKSQVSQEQVIKGVLILHLVNWYTGLALSLIHI